MLKKANNLPVTIFFASSSPAGAIEMTIPYEVLQTIFATGVVFAHLFLQSRLALQILANKLQLPEVGHLFAELLQKVFLMLG